MKRYRIDVTRAVFTQSFFWELWPLDGAIHLDPEATGRADTEEGAFGEAERYARRANDPTRWSPPREITIGDD